MNSDNEVYFVLSDGDAPKQIKFDELTAFMLGYEYVDSFDAEGELVYAYHLCADGTYETDF